jgi:hypothetical protein
MTYGGLSVRAREDDMRTQGHTAQELHAILSEQIDRVTTDETTPARVNAIVNATSAKLRIVKLQMDYAKQRGSMPEIPLLATGAAEKQS